MTDVHLDANDTMRLTFQQHNYLALLNIIKENTDQRAVAFAKAVYPTMRYEILQLSPDGLNQ